MYWNGENVRSLNKFFMLFSYLDFKCSFSSKNCLSLWIVSFKKTPVILNEIKTKNKRKKKLKHVLHFKRITYKQTTAFLRWSNFQLKKYKWFLKNIVWSYANLYLRNRGIMECNRRIQIVSLALVCLEGRGLLRFLFLGRSNRSPFWKLLRRKLF